MNRQIFNVMWNYIAKISILKSAARVIKREKQITAKLSVDYLHTKITVKSLKCNYAFTYSPYCEFIDR